MSVEAITSTDSHPIELDKQIDSINLSDFWEIPWAQRTQILEDAIRETHAWHYLRNPAYRGTLSARGVGESITPSEVSMLLRPTAQTFKSYIDLIGTPFPQDKPRDFLEWLNDQLSIELPVERFDQFRDKYDSLEGLLSAIESSYADYSMEVITSSGTSGRSTIMVRDREAIEKTVESFYLSFQRYFEMQADHWAIFIMPHTTRIAMARMASFSVKRIGLPPDHIHYTIPYAADPDRVRVRAGRTFRPGFSGLIERRVMHPFINWAYEKLAQPRTVQSTLQHLQAAQAASEKVLLFGGLVQLHAVATTLKEKQEVLRLAPGSLVGTGGGMKELYPYTPSQIRHDLSETIELADGNPIPIRDVYGMAEGNWAAMECRAGNYHVPPWISAVTLDDNGDFQDQVDASGLLAFYDPFGGGRLFPSFFKTADQMRLINGGSSTTHPDSCPCGESGAFILGQSIQRVDLMDEAGCAAQV